MEKKRRPQDVWNEKNGLVSVSYKLQKEIADAFAEACQKAGTSKKAQLEKMMMEFVEQVNNERELNEKNQWNDVCGQKETKIIYRKMQ